MGEGLLLLFLTLTNKGHKLHQKRRKPYATTFNACNNGCVVFVAVPPVRKLQRVERMEAEGMKRITKMMMESSDKRVERGPQHDG